jgi:hypothetical protein
MVKYSPFILGNPSVLLQGLHLQKMRILSLPVSCNVSLKITAYRATILIQHNSTPQHLFLGYSKTTCSYTETSKKFITNCVYATEHNTATYLTKFASQLTAYPHRSTDLITYVLNLFHLKPKHIKRHVRTTIHQNIAAYQYSDF